MAQSQDLKELWQKVRPPENMEQAERNMEYIRFVVKDDINKMMTFMSMEEFAKVKLELQLLGKNLNEASAEEVAEAYLSAYGKMAQEEKYISIIKLREAIRKEGTENGELIKRINAVTDSIKRKFLFSEEVGGILYAILCDRNYDIFLRKKLHDISKERNSEIYTIQGKWLVKKGEEEIRKDQIKCEIEERKFPDIVELRETFKFFDIMSVKEEKKNDTEVNKMFSMKKNIKCHFCQKLGHIMKECWRKHPELRRERKENFTMKKNVKMKKVEEYDEEEDEDCRNVMMLAAIEGERKIMMKTRISCGDWIIEKEIEADTGCRITVIPEKWLNENQMKMLKEGQYKFIKGVGGGKRKVKSYLDVSIMLENKIGKKREIDTTVMVVEDLQEPLLGREDLSKLRLINDLQEMAIKVISTEKEQRIDKELNYFKEKFPILTSKSIGKVERVQLKLRYKKDRKKYFCKPREFKSSILKELVEKKIEYYIEEGIYEPILYSDEAYPIVPVLKGISKIKDQSELTIDNIRITGDFSLYNKGLIIPSICMKTVNSELEKINRIEGRGELIYSVFDLSDGYTSLEMEPETRTILSTPKGLMLMKRLSQGLASAPALYTMFMEKKVISVMERKIKEKKLEKKVQILNIMDDLMVVTRSYETNKMVVNMLGELLQKLNVRINVQKSKIGRKSVEFCGVQLSRTGYSVKMGRVEKLLALKIPENASQLKSFLGLCNTMIRFVKNLAKYKRVLEAKLNGIRTKKEAYKFEKLNEEEILAFENLKKVIAEEMIENCLVDQKEIIEYRIQADASAEAVGSMLEGKIRTKEGMEWLPLECHSRCFQGSQKKWPIQHKEAFGLYDAVRRWLGRIIGVKTTLLTDHESLSKVFSPGPMGLANKTYSARIWRWAQSLLSIGTLVVSYKGQKAVSFADCLSRLTDADCLMDEEDETIIANFVNCMERRTFTLDEVREIASHDVEYQEWVESISDGKIPDIFKKQEDIHVEKKIIKVGVKVVLPYDLQKEALKIVHETHMGKKALCFRLEREFWWPKLRKDVEEKCSSCEECIKFMKAPNKEEGKWEETNYFLQRVHIDQGQFENSEIKFLVMRDSHTGYVQTKIVQSERPIELIQFIEEIEKYMGNISCIVSDQQRSMISLEVKSHFKEKQFLLVGTEVHKSNGLAEGTIREIKKRAKKMNFSASNMLRKKEILRRIVEDMNKVPCGGREQSPYEMIFRDEINRDRILQRTVTLEKQPKFLVGEKVLFKLARMDGFEEAIVLENMGSKICKVKRLSNGREYTIHNDSIRKKPKDLEKNEIWNLFPPGEEGGKVVGRLNDEKKIVCSNDAEKLDKEIEAKLKEIQKETIQNNIYKNPRLPNIPLNASLRSERKQNHLSLSSRNYSRPWRIKEGNGIER